PEGTRPTSKSPCGSRPPPPERPNPHTPPSSRSRPGVSGGRDREGVLSLRAPPVEVTDNQVRMEQIARRYWPTIQGNATTAWVYFQGVAIYFAGQNVVDITQYLPPG